MLRAIKFAARLGFTIEEETLAALVRHRKEINKCAAPRVLEEFYRLMVAIKTTPAAAAAVEAALGAVGIAAHIVVDPTDLVCLPALAVPWLVGCAHIARLPLGRLEVLVDDYANWRLASAAAIEVELSDLISCGATSDAVGDLAGAVAAYVDRKDINGLERALAALRD